MIGLGKIDMDIWDSIILFEQVKTPGTMEVVNGMSE